MRVVFLHQSFASDKDEGSGRANDFARRLVQDGHEVTVVAGQFSYLTGRVRDEYRGRLLVREAHPDGYTVLRTWTPSGYHGSYLSRALGFAAYMVTSFFTILLKTKCDVLIAACPPVTVGMVGGLAAWCKRGVFIYEIRDLWVEGAIELGIVRNRFLLSAVRAWERSLYRQARSIVINSPGFTSYLLRDGARAADLRFVPNGVDAEAFRPGIAGDAVRAQWQLDGKFVVVYAGSLGLANDIPTILRAAERLREDPQVRILLVGDGNRRRQAEEEARARKLDNVIFTGPVPKQDIPAYLNAADVGLCTLLDTPLFRTVYPNKVFDAMACARPVIVLVDGVIREVVENARAGVFVRPGDDAGLADALRDLKADPALRALLGANGRRVVEERFTRTQAAEAMSRVVAEVER